MKGIRPVEIWEGKPPGAAWRMRAALLEINGDIIDSSISACLHVAFIIKTHSIHPSLFLEVV
jgi:hypothetical protein